MIDERALHIANNSKGYANVMVIVLQHPYEMVNETFLPQFICIRPSAGSQVNAMAENWVLVSLNMQIEDGPISSSGAKHNRFYCLV